MLASACTEWYPTRRWTEFAEAVPGGRKSLPYLKTRQLLPQLDPRQSISCGKKMWSEALHLLPTVLACSCLHIHLPGGLNHCTADGLTWCREATSHAFPTVHRGCDTIHPRLMSHTVQDDVFCAMKYTFETRNMCGHTIDRVKAIKSSWQYSKLYWNDPKMDYLTYVWCSGAEKHFFFFSPAKQRHSTSATTITRKVMCSVLCGRRRKIPFPSQRVRHSIALSVSDSQWTVCACWLFQAPHWKP